MSQSKEVTVRLQALDGGWETCGVDRLRGITPEIAPQVANGWGPDTASFDLRRDPKAVWPDLGAWTPAEIEIGGVLVWDGRVKETPSRDGADRVMSVQCEGWQYHLDDDLYERSYVHNRVDDWKDMRSFPGAPLSYIAPRLSVTTGAQALIGCANGVVWATGSWVGVTLDLGPSNFPKRVVLSAYKTSTMTNMKLYIRGHPDFTFGSYADYVAADDAALFPAAGSVRTVGGTITQNYRYVSVFINQPVGQFTCATDEFLVITDIKVFADTAYESGNASILKAPTVIGDALDRTTVLLSSDRSQIDPGGTVAFSIPSLAPGEPKTPREMWDAVNAYHDYTSKLAVGRVPVFKPKPAAALFEVGAWSAMEFEDASANSGADIYNRVLVTGQTPDGSPLRVERTAAALTQLYIPLAGLDPVSASVTSASGALPRTVSTAFNGTFRRGRRYRITARASWSTNVDPLTDGTVRVGPAGGTDFQDRVLGLVGPAGAEFTLEWTPTQDYAGSSVTLDLIVRATGPGTGTATLSAIRVEASAATLADRRGFRRSKSLQVRSTLPADGVAAAQIGDVWLASHKTTPFKGTVKLTGDQAVRSILTGQYVPLERLLLATGELLRFSDRVDPDTGAWGRDGRIAQVSYDHAKNEATVTLDSGRAGFEALLERLAVVTGGSS